MYVAISKCRLANTIARRNAWQTRATTIGLNGARTDKVRFPKTLTLCGSQMQLIAIERESIEINGRQVERPTAAIYESTGVTRKQYRTPGEVTLTIVNE